MASESVLAAQTSSVTASLTRVSGVAPVEITNMQLLPRVGTSQSVKINMVIDGEDYEMQVNLFDEAFDQYDLYGKPKRKESAG